MMSVELGPFLCPWLSSRQRIVLIDSLILNTIPNTPCVCLMENRGSLRKTSMETSGLEPGNKRARYAPKACDACRKRKGRCDGLEPCAYCVGRRQPCSYSINSVTPNEWGSDTAVRSPEGRTPQNVKDLAWVPEYVPDIYLVFSFSSFT